MMDVLIIRHRSCVCDNTAGKLDTLLSLEETRSAASMEKPHCIFLSATSIPRYQHASVLTPAISRAHQASSTISIHNTPFPKSKRNHHNPPHATTTIIIKSSNKFLKAYTPKSSKQRLSKSPLKQPFKTRL